MTKQIHLEKRERIAQILRAALKLAPRVGYNRLTREQIATEANVAPTLITHYFGTMVGLRRDIMREAVRVECLPVIAQGIALRDRHAQKAPDDVRQRAIATLC